MRRSQLEGEYSDGFARKPASRASSGELYSLADLVRREETVCTLLCGADDKNRIALSWDAVSNSHLGLAANPNPPF